MMATLERAIEIATSAHEGQFDKGGNPYILHPLRVMARMQTNVLRIIAVLHDVVEDTEVTLDDLRVEGFSEIEIAGVDAMTRRPGETYREFITRVKLNQEARQVKIADIEENMDLSRIPNYTAQDVRRLVRYREALADLLYAV